MSMMGRVSDIARHVIACRSTQETRVRLDLRVDVVAGNSNSNIFQALL
jgi:hypothetical protein